MNILLVYPKNPDTFWGFSYVLRFISKKAAYPPLGLLTIASMLPKDWNKKLIDLNVIDLSDFEIQNADMVFISAMLVQKVSAQEIIGRCNKFGKKVVVGGPAFSTNYKQFKGVSYYVLNEAEITLPRFLDDLKNGKPKKVYSSKKRPDITKTPIPSWHLINFKDYATMPIQYSRGCPFNCEFCDIVIMNGRVPRTKSPDQMILELNSLYNAGWRGTVFIVDDNFIGNKVKAKIMLAYVINWQKTHKYPFQFFTEASLNLADDDKLLELMSKANFFKVFLGIETPLDSSLKECGKNQNVSKDLGKAVEKIHSYGMQVMGGFIVGFDNDPEHIFETQIKFIQKIGVVTAMVGVLTALPQTRLWRRLKDEGRLLKESSGENTDGSLNFVPKMGKEKLEEGYKKIIETIYSRKLYYKRVHTFIKSYRPTVKSRLTKYDVSAFFKSMWSIGVLSRSRFSYWWLLIKTSMINRRAFPIAVELAIIGLHFEKVSQQILMM